MDKLIQFIFFLALISCAGNKSGRESTLNYDEREKLFEYQNRLKNLESLNDELVFAFKENTCSADWEARVKKLKDSLYTAKDNKKPYTWFELGNCYMYIKDYKKALFYYELTESSGTKDTKIISSLYYNIGVSYYAVKQFELAKSYFELARKNDDPKALSLFQLSLINLSDGNFKASLQHLMALERKYRKSDLVKYLKGVNYFYMRDINSLRNKVLNRLDEKFLGKALLEVALNITSEQKRVAIINNNTLDNLESDIIYFEKFRQSLLKEIDN